ncbi:MAG TPA: helix-turn-helix domain-containing protein [Micropepsaceae bacterium]|nr:helix-turn-helix domain-containing protein [Micropepsaceae bacterium]
MAKVTRLSLDGGGSDRKRLHLREISNDADAPLETVGQDLRSARQKRGEEFKDIAKELKIRRDYLEAIEESRFDALPGRTYAIGFIRTYAEYLGLDGAECVDRLKAEIAGRGDAKEHPVSVSAPRERRIPQGAIALIVLLLIAAVYLTYYLYVSAERIAAPPVTPVPARLTEQVAPTPPPQVPASEQTASAPDAAASAEPAPVPVPPPAAPAEALAQGTKYGAQNLGSRVTLIAHKLARVTVLGANNRLFLDRALQPGDSYLVPNVLGLTLTTTDGGAIEFILDGNSLGYAAKEGVVSNISLNPRDVAARKTQ